MLVDITSIMRILNLVLAEMLRLVKITLSVNKGIYGMNTSDDNSQVENDAGIPPQSTMVSLFGSNAGANDFPVLKAFQEYIDAEQARARKRMVGLAAFFIVLLVVVVVTFTLIMTAFISRNQALSDKLLDIALRERNQTPQPVVTVQQPPAPQPVAPPPQTHESLLKPVLEQLEKLATAMAKSQQQTPAPTPVVVAAAPTPQPVAVTLPSVESVETLKLREELRKQQEEFKAEKEKLKEAIHQAEIEKHRRRLYPEYYAQEDAKKQEESKNVSSHPVKPFKPAEAPRAAQKPVPQPPAPKVKNTSTAQPKPSTRAESESVKAHQTEKPVNLKSIKPINYFENGNEDKELKEMLEKAKAKVPTASSAASKPSAVPLPQTKQETKSTPPSQVSKAKPSQTATPSVAKPTIKTETISVGQSETNSIPWLIEVPAEGK